MKIAVAGAGWYGCHIATTLQSIGIDVQLYEKSHRPLNDASGNNQFRLHMGFHYARSYVTRLQSRDGYSRFLERYPGLSREIKDNLYAVPKYDSLLDYLTYKLVMTAAGIEFNEVHAQDYGLDSVSGVIRCDERVLLTERSRKYFSERLGSSILLNTKIDRIENVGQKIVVNGTPYDFLIDATWGHLTPVGFSVFYEPTLLLYYRCTEPFPAVTLVDGPLCSIYPTESEGIYTLSSVPHTPIGQYTTPAEARAALDAISEELIYAKRKQMEDQVSKYVPAFREKFEYVEPQRAIKTKLYGHQDDRSCYVSHNGRLISVMSGKIDTIFFAAQRIISIIESIAESGNHAETSCDEHIVLS